MGWTNKKKKKKKEYVVRTTSRKYTAAAVPDSSCKQETKALQVFEARIVSYGVLSISVQSVSIVQNVQNETYRSHTCVWHVCTVHQCTSGSIRRTFDIWIISVWHSQWDGSSHPSAWGGRNMSPRDTCRLQTSLYGTVSQHLVCAAFCLRPSAFPGPGPLTSDFTPSQQYLLWPFDNDTHCTAAHWDYGWACLINTAAEVFSFQYVFMACGLLVSHALLHCTWIRAPEGVWSFCVTNNAIDTAVAVRCSGSVGPTYISWAIPMLLIVRGIF